MSRETVEVSVGTTRFSTGETVKVTPRFIFKNPGDGSTPDHEARHALVATLRFTTVYFATCVGGEGYHGMVSLARYDGAAFMASDGCSGTGHDRWVVGMMGDSPSGKAAEARSLLCGRDDERIAIGSWMRDRGTITGDEVKWAMNEAVNPEVYVEETNSEGKSRQYTTRIRRVRGHFIPFPVEISRN